MSRLDADPEYQRKKAERDAELAQRAELLRSAERPIVADLRDAGLDVESVWDLVNTSTPYPDALPVLLVHLGQGGYPDRVMESLGRALAVRPAGFVWQTLRDHYVRAAGSSETEGLAVALAAAATAEHLDSVIELLEDDSRGQSRIHFLRTIKRLGGDQGLRLLSALRDDPVFGKEATALLKTRQTSRR